VRIRYPRALHRCLIAAQGRSQLPDRARFARVTIPVYALTKVRAMSTLNRAEISEPVTLPGISAALRDRERWYAVHTMPLREAYAEGHLRNQAFQTFLPKRRKTVRHARKLRAVEAAFFPRYLFVILDLTRHQWRSVNGTFGVSRLVMRGDEPYPVPCGLVEALTEMADADGFLRFGETLKVGSPVRLLAGPFADQLAILDHLDASGRVRVLLDILGRQVPISTDSDNLLPLIETRQ
jgi:transcription elongation factor/antiterminator RfaH